MGFWSTDLKEPLRQHRWTLILPSVLSPVEFALKECQKPSYDIGITEHRLLTHTIKYPTLLKWKPIEIKIVSIAGSEGAGSLVEFFINNLGYKYPTGNHQQFAKINSQDFTIRQFDDDGNLIEEWELVNCFVTSVNHGSLSYENEGFVDISLTVQYDYAILTTPETDPTQLDTATDAVGRPSGVP